MTVNETSWLDRYSDILKDQKLLQLNCSGGEDTKVLCEIAASVTAMDEDISSVWQLPMFHPNLKVEQIDLNAEFLLSETQFDHIVAGYCLNPYSVEDGRKIVNKLHQLLKQDGIIIGRLLSVREIMDNPSEFSETEDGMHSKDGETSQYYDKNILLKLFGNRWEIELISDGKDGTKDADGRQYIEFTSKKLR